MILALGFSIAGLISLVTLHLAHRIGVRDVRQWLTDREHERLKHIATAWQLLAPSLAIIVALSAPLPLAPAINESAPFAWPNMIAGFALCGVFAGLLCALARIDLCCRLLPDQLNLWLLVSGLAFHVLIDSLAILDAVIGAAAGYAMLGLLAWLYQRLRRIEAIGRGDVAMAAGLGAWLGWQSLPLALAIASITALILMALLRWCARHALMPRATSALSMATHFFQTHAAFGPALAIGGLLTWVQLG